ncbi:MAG: hypothetical protein HYU71_01970 [Bacteroidetes bacterium]|nr:hypothetical protein [Bacteroidota bacterium]
MRSSLHKWLQVSVLNLLLVSLIGVVLRYKIAFSLPFIDQKHLLHGHSHFAFSGWITHTLMVLLVQYLSEQSGRDQFRKYRSLLWGNLLTAYGMLLWFPIQGYGPWSITFSTLSIFVSWIFAVVYWKDLNRLSVQKISHSWFKLALLFNAVSALGAFALAFMMATQTVHQNWYLAAVYFFLHFQYNGWFFFAAMGLLTARLETLVFLRKKLWYIYLLFAFACIPAYLLSALWLPMSQLVYVLVIAAAIAQVLAWWLFLSACFKNRAEIRKLFPGNSQWLLLLAALATSIKLLLQLGSTIPSLSQLAFGFRPIVIGYLHLVLLGMFSIFLIGQLAISINNTLSKILLTGIRIFVAGVIINEIVLMVQGTAALSYQSIPFINESLLATALILFTGILVMLLAFRKIKPGN